MKYKLGDFVRFVDEKMEGYVTRIIDDQMIGVTGTDDFEIPVLASKVTTVHGHQTSSDKTVPVTDAAIQATAQFVNRGIYLGVVPDARANAVVHFHLVNDTSFQLLAVLTTDKQQTFKSEFAGVINPASTAKIYSAQLADLQLWPLFSFQIIYSTPQNVEPPAPLIIKEKFKAKDFSDTRKNISQLNQQAGWLIRLDEPELVIDPEKLKESFFKTAAEKVTVEKPASEIDLHIEKLRSDYHFLQSSEIFDIQIAHFNKALDAAIVHQQPEITFIHGAGNGILRHELHKQLGRHPKVKTFMDARKEKFGYGATKVILK